jgi:3-hydroxyisobutyrate dehydrogenase-like beta-hydroxyacid dehydrogenase
MLDASVIGLGTMGSTLARLLLQKGCHVTVWNRTIAKAKPLVQSGAVLAPNVAAAVSASPIIAKLFKRAMAAGYGNEEAAALIKVLR